MGEYPVLFINSSFPMTDVVKVAITLYGTYVPAYESIFGPFPSDQAEQLLQEFSIMGTSL